MPEPGEAALIVIGIDKDAEQIARGHARSSMCSSANSQRGYGATAAAPCPGSREPTAAGRLS